MTRYRDEDDGTWVSFRSERGGTRPTDNEPAWVRTLSNDQRDTWRKDQQTLETYRQIWQNNGQINPLNPAMKISMQELLQRDEKHTAIMHDSFSSDWPSLTKRVIDETIRHAKEPSATLAGQVFSIENLDPSEIPISLAMGAVVASHIAEGAEYPEVSMEPAGDESHGFAKHGLAVKVTDEMLRWFRADMLDQGVTLASNALVRLRETQIASAIESDGTTVIDNSSSSFKSTEGRADDGTHNGTLTTNDLWFTYRAAIDDGYYPNALIVHPSAWNIFLADESMRKAFDLDRGHAPLYISPQGEAGGIPWHSQTPTLTRQSADVPGEIATLKTGPNTLFPTISRIIPSAYLTWDNTSKRATVAMVDTNNCGTVQQASSSPEIEEFRDFARDLNKIKLRWFWHVSTLNAGEGIWLMKSISTEQSTDWSNRIQVTMPHTGFADQFLSGQYFSGVT